MSTERASQGGPCQEMVPGQLPGVHDPALREQVRPLVYSLDRFNTRARRIQCCPSQPQGSLGGTAQAGPRDAGSPRPKAGSEAVKTCQNTRQRRCFGRMSIAAEKVVEMLALPEQDRAYLARQLIASLDDTVDADAETQWHAVIDRRSREIEEGKVSCRPVEQVVQDVRASKP